MKKHNNPLSLVIAIALSLTAIYGLLLYAGWRQGGSWDEALKVMLQIVPFSGIMLSWACELLTNVFHLSLDTTHYLAMVPALDVNMVVTSLCQLAVIAVCYEVMMSVLKSVFGSEGIWNKLKMVFYSMMAALFAALVGGYAFSWLMQHFDVINSYLKTLSVTLATAVGVGGAAALMKYHFGLTLAKFGAFIVMVTLMMSIIKIVVTYLMMISAMMIMQDGSFLHYLAGYSSYFGLSGIVLAIDQLIHSMFMDRA